MKKSFLFILIVACTCKAYSQFNVNWSNAVQFTTTSGYSNEARKVASDASGNVFMLWDITADQDSTGHPVTTTQYYVVLTKYNFSGNPLAQKIVNVSNMALSGAHDFKASFALELDGSGNVYIGYTKFNSVTNYDVGVTKFNNALALQWNFIYSTGSIEQGIDMKLRGIIPFVLVKSTTGANVKYSLVKAVANTTVTTPFYSFVVNNDVVNAMVTNSTNNIFVTGYNISTGVKRGMTACVTPAGVLKWRSSFNHGSAAGDDFGSKLLIGTDGDLYVSGTSTIVNSPHVNDATVLRYANATGLLVNSLDVNHEADDAGADILNGPPGFLYQAMSHGNKVNVTKIQTGTGILAIAGSSFYNPIPVSPYTTLTGVTVSDMKVAASGNVYVCGSITGTSAAGNFSASWLCKAGTSGANFALLNHQDVEGDFTASFSGVSLALDAAHNDILSLRSTWRDYNTHASEKVSITDLDGGVTLRTASEDGDNAEAVSDVSFYPNPSSGKINLRTDATVTSVEISDLSGKIVVTLKPVESRLDISTLAPGLYLAKVITETGSVVKKITLE